MRNRGGSVKQTEGDGSTVQMGEIWPLPPLYGSGGMVSGCEACHGAASTCIGSRYLLSPEAGPCRGRRGYWCKQGALWCCPEEESGAWGSLGNLGHWLMQCGNAQGLKKTDQCRISWFRLPLAPLIWAHFLSLCLHIKYVMGLGYIFKLKYGCLHFAFFVKCFFFLNLSVY